LGVGHLEGAHDIRLQRSDEQFIGLMQEHKNKEDDDGGLCTFIHLRLGTLGFGNFH
jgi:hypothetical protein